jgi:formate hydrogenlyase subunit 6/NADH:ubiquinone oxidoreductase subunit I
MANSSANPQAVVLERRNFQQLLDVLHARGYQIIAPTVRAGAIIYDEVHTVAELPIGWTDEHDGGQYRLHRRNDEALFGYVVGPHSWKRFLHPPRERLWQAQREANGFQIVPETEAPPKRAFLGVRSCELHAIAIQDKVFHNDQFTDTFYQARRNNTLLIAVNCRQAGGTCFCVSMNTGPQVTSGYDLALTEIIEDNQHYFVIEAGTENGAEILQAVQHRAASEVEQQKAVAVVAQAARQMGRTMDTSGIKELLYENLDHPRWDEVANRCLTCANCTMVCPTCFCTTVEDVTDLTGEHAERWRRWDSCFTLDFAYLHGGNVRASAKSRYRQWMTHKLASWHDQFGSSGCVGCGRCITWCPVGIDLTEEARAIREQTT